MPTPSSTVADHPDQLELWDIKRNLPVTPETTGHRSSRRYWWSCPVADDHVWEAATASIARSLAKGFNGCPACAGRQVSVTNSLATQFPDVAAQWHPSRNGELTPDQLPAGTEQRAWWRCEAGPDHEWRALISSRTKAGVGCPACSGKKPSVTNSVASVPHLADEWHPTRNLPFTADTVVAGTSRKLWWQCSADRSHEWRAIGSNRLKGRGCPYCYVHLRSTLEICLAYELADFVPALDLDDDKVIIDAKVRHVDLLLRGLNVAVELDGRYHHADSRDADRRKSAALEADGWLVIRLREHPLEPLGRNDLQLPENPTTKRTADLLLIALLDRGLVERAQVEAYLARYEPTSLTAALAEVGRRRPGKPIRIPGTPPGPDRMTRWESSYTALLAYVDREGHSVVPDGHVENELNLGGWVSAQRSRHRREKLQADRVARLEAVPGWVWGVAAAVWEDGFAHLKTFLDREGHLRVPAEHAEPDGYPLGSWVRSHRRRGGRRSMTEAQRCQLEALPGWSYDSAVDQHWDRAYEALVAFASEAGHVRAPRSGELDLRAWVGLQRQRYRADTLAPQRVARLEQVRGWSWDPQTDAWEAGFDALRVFSEREGHALVRRDNVVDGYPLGAWVGEQRASRTELSDDRRVRLEQVRGWSWAPHEERWECAFALLEHFVARQGHAGVPTGYVENGVQLGSWVVRHRLEHKRGDVPEDRARRLEALPGWMWDTRATSWETHFQALAAYASQHGTARVPSEHREGDVRLGAWVVTQRANRRRGVLAEDRCRRLESLPGWAWDGRYRAVPPTLW